MAFKGTEKDDIVVGSFWKYLSMDKANPDAGSYSENSDFEVVRLDNSGVNFGRTLPDYPTSAQYHHDYPKFLSKVIPIGNVTDVKIKVQLSSIATQLHSCGGLPEIYNMLVDLDI